MHGQSATTGPTKVKLNGNALGGGGSNGHGRGAGIGAADRLGQSTKRIDGHNAAVHLSVIQVFRQDAAL